MTYREQYYQIINFRKQNPLSDTEYGEVHHIVPKSLGGSNAKENLIKLTAAEHYKVHCILPYMYLEEGNKNGYIKMLCAWIRLSNSPQNVNPDLSHVDKDAEEYERLRKEYSEYRRSKVKGTHLSEETKRKLSEARKGDKNPMFGKKTRGNTGKSMSEEAKAKISATNKGKVPSEETRKKRSDSLKALHREGSGNPCYGKRFYCNPERTEHVFSDVCPEGWQPGMKYISRSQHD